MTANYIASLAFGLIVTVSSGAFFAVAWIASSIPSVGIA
jgi:hypothetical protein